MQISIFALDTDINLHTPRYFFRLIVPLQSVRRRQNLPSLSALSTITQTLRPHSQRLCDVSFTVCAVNTHTDFFRSVGVKGSNPDIFTI